MECHSVPKLSNYIDGWLFFLEHKTRQSLSFSFSVWLVPCGTTVTIYPQALAAIHSFAAVVYSNDIIFYFYPLKCTLRHKLASLWICWNSDRKPHNSNITGDEPFPRPSPSSFVSSLQKCSWRQAINSALTLKGCKPEIVPMTSPCR